MPLRHRKQIEGPTVFYVTTSTLDRRLFPGLPNNYVLLEKLLFETAVDKLINIFAYVIMPTHLHALLGSIHGGPVLSRFMHSFKGRARERMVGKGIFWQSRFDDLVIYSQKVFETKLIYIHNNPIRAGLVSNPEDWPYSSYIDWINQISSKGLTFTYQEWYKNEDTLGIRGAVGLGDPTAQF
jgi:putative transposase